MGTEQKRSFEHLKPNVPTPYAPTKFNKPVAYHRGLSFAWRHTLQREKSPTRQNFETVAPPHSYYSATFIPGTRKNYDIYERELLTIKALKHWRHRLWGRIRFPFTSCHGPRQPRILKEPSRTLNRRTARWHGFLKLLGSYPLTRANVIRQLTSCRGSQARRGETDTVN